MPLWKNESPISANSHADRKASMDESSRPYSRLHIWVLASRPKTLWAAISPVVIGIAMAFEAGKGGWGAAIAALLGGVLLQIGANFANDYLDYVKGTDTHERLGPMRVTHAGLVSPLAMKLATTIVFALAFLCGVYLVWQAGWPIAIIGVLSILFAVLYTAGPYPLGYYGLGDIFALIFFGPIATGGTYYAQALDIRPEVVIAGFAPGLFAVALLTVNNLRDADNDAKAGKKTLPVRFGKQFARAEYVTSVLLAALAIPLATFAVTRKHPLSLIAIAVGVLALPAIKSVYRDTGRTLNGTLAQTGRLNLFFALLFSLGWLL